MKNVSLLLTVLLTLVLGRACTDVPAYATLARNMAKVIKCPEEVRAEMRAEREAKRAKAANKSLFAANMPNKSGQMEAASLSYVSGGGMMQSETNDRGYGRKEVSARAGLPMVHEDTLSGSNMTILKSNIAKLDEEEDDYIVPRQTQTGRGSSVRDEIFRLVRLRYIK